MKISKTTGFHYITFQLNGKEVNLLVDSGCAGQMVISKNAGDALGAIHESNTGGTGISGEFQGSISVFDSLTITHLMIHPRRTESRFTCRWMEHQAMVRRIT